MIVRAPCDEAAIRGRLAATPCAPGTGGWVLAATVLGSGMVFIDSSAVNVALPLMQRDLGASVTAMQWVIEIYMLFLGALILAGGALGDRLGRRRVFIWGVAIFALASVWCGLAPRVSPLIVARAVQGVGGALLVPGSLAIISASFDDASRGRAIGTWSGMTAITMAAGPVAGGWLAETFSWRWVFFLNIPFAVVVLAIAATRVPESRDESRPAGMDWLGAGLSVSGLGALVYGLVESSSLGWRHPLVAGSIAAGFVLLAIFARVEQRSPSPMMPLDLFGSRSFTGANVLTFLLYGALGGVLFYLPFNLIQLQGFSATEAGAALLPFILTVAILSRAAGALVPVVGARRLLVAGPLVTAAGFALAARPGAGAGYWTTFFPAFLAMGLGMATTVAPLVTVVMDAAGPDRVGAASGINNAVSRVAGLIVLAALGMVVVATFNSRLDARLAELEIRPVVLERFAPSRADLAAAVPPPDATAREARDLEAAVQDAFIAAFRLAMLSAAGLAATGAAVAWFTIDRRFRP